VLDWRSLFVCVAVYGLVALLLAATTLDESLPMPRRGARDTRSVVARYRQVLGDRSFVGVALIGGLMVSGVFAYMTSSSFLLQEVYGLDANGYSAVFTANALAFVLGAQAVARVVGRVTPRTIFGGLCPLSRRRGSASRCRTGSASVCRPSSAARWCFTWPQVRAGRACRRSAWPATVPAPAPRQPCWEQPTSGSPASSRPWSEPSA
jgi:hypothetical protein